MRYFLPRMYTFLILTLLYAFMFISLVFAAETELAVEYEPLTPNFAAEQKSVVYAVFNAKNDSIAAAKVSIESTGGVTILDVLDPVDTENKPLANVKVVDKKVSAHTVSETILIVQSGSALPSVIKVPVVVVGKKDKSGNLTLDIQKSQIVNANGVSYALQQSKKSMITFSQEGKTLSVVPSPTPLPANTMTLHITAKLQGTSPTVTKLKSVSGVRVQLLNKTNNTVIAAPPQYITLNMNDAGMWEGNVSVTGMQPGNNYQLLIKGPKHLQKRICENTPTEQAAGTYTCNSSTMKLTTGQNEVNLSGVTLMSGDVGIQDGILNGYDLSFVQNIIRKTSSSSTEDGDINYDGKVNKIDYDLVTDSLLTTIGLDQK